MTRRRLVMASCVLAVVGTIATAIGFAVEPTQAAFSYLTAWAFAVSIALGALVFAMMGHAIEARWTVVFQPLTDAIIKTLPLIAVLFVPIALAMRYLYAWVDPSPALGAEALGKLAHKAPYLNVTFWVIRAIVFFVVWIVAGELLVRGRDAQRKKVMSVVLLPAIGLTLTFGAFDWLMSLTPLWYSTIFGLLYWSGGFIGALSLIAVLVWAARVPVHASHSGALGRMMFGFLVFWAYMEFAQGLIIWIANKPDEVPWYVARGAGLWGGTFALLVVGHFGAPFFALLSRPLKRRPALLAIVAGWLVAMHYVDLYWMVMPVLHKTFALHWLDIAAPCAVLGWVAAFAAVRTRSAVDPDDPRLPAAITYEGT